MHLPVRFVYSTKNIFFKIVLLENLVQQLNETSISILLHIAAFNFYILNGLFCVDEVHVFNVSIILHKFSTNECLPLGLCIFVCIFNFRNMNSNMHIIQ